MSRLTDLIATAKARDVNLGADLEREFRSLADRLAFGLNFERHRPEAVELPSRPIRKGDKVRILPPRKATGKRDPKLWLVKMLGKEKPDPIAELKSLDGDQSVTRNVAVSGLVVVAEFRDFIYPGLMSTGRVGRGGDKPCHSVISERWRLRDSGIGESQECPALPLTFVREYGDENRRRMLSKSYQVRAKGQDRAG